jgi:peptidoglycan/xylan/chitin deacetylase (PgdA/CDA1 family)
VIPAAKLWIKRLLFRLLYYSGVELLLARSVKVNAAAVIMYHGVCDDSRLPPEVDFHLPRSVFEAHMRMLKRRYPVVPLRELLDRLERGEDLRRDIVITFDDGYRNNATAAHPILERYGLPYTIFLTTGHIGGTEWLPLNRLYALWHAGRISDARMKELRARIRRTPSNDTVTVLDDLGAELTPAEVAGAEESFAMLSWDEVRDLAARGVEIGSHTHTHCNMAVEAAERQCAELETAAGLIQAETGSFPATFAYPFGRLDNWNQETRRQVIAAGHRCAILASGGVVTRGQDPFALPRVSYTRETWYFACDLLLHFLKQSGAKRKGLG